MNSKIPNYIDGVQIQKTDAKPFWRTKKNKKERGKMLFPFTGLFTESRRKTEESILGPGGGIGIGCGVGVGFGVVGGIGYGGWPWSHLHMVFGVGMGCGVGVGFGYGQGLGLGFTLESLKSYLSTESPRDPNKRIIIQI
uniref:Uncharacterized protein n=1 Tax=Nelumbo nucifera TaxID=4432 RepID=A0A822Z1S5_NELNU|nr:TPA_asm: hypothetical protein HUJ06_006088 [Nelumbo nucifera]